MLPINTNNNEYALVNQEEEMRSEDDANRQPPQREQKLEYNIFLLLTTFADCCPFT